MKFFLISDNVDTKMGMRFAGIEGVVVHQEDEVRSELEKAVNRDDIAVILITETLVSLCPDLIYDLKLNRKQGPSRSDRAGQCPLSRYARSLQEHACADPSAPC